MLQIPTATNKVQPAADEKASLVAFVDDAKHHGLLDVIRDYLAAEMRVCCTTVTSSEKEELRRKRACLVRGHLDGKKFVELGGTSSKVAYTAKIYIYLSECKNL